LGSINTADQGHLYLLGQHISNQGTLTSLSGDIHLASASEAIITMDASGLLSLELVAPVQEKGQSDAIIENSGNVTANEGNIFIDMFYLDSLNVEPINNEGIANATAIAETNGRIFLTSTSLNVGTVIQDIVEASVSEITSEVDQEQLTDIDLPTDPNRQFENFVPECDPLATPHRCKKQAAINNFLKSLLIDGAMP
jgi:hypothetical protein